jgi:hypothetical protein
MHADRCVRRCRAAGAGGHGRDRPAPAGGDKRTMGQETNAGDARRDTTAEAIGGLRSRPSAASRPAVASTPGSRPVWLPSRCDPEVGARWIVEVCGRKAAACPSPAGSTPGLRGPVDVSRIARTGQQSFWRSFPEPRCFTPCSAGCVPNSATTATYRIDTGWFASRHSNCPSGYSGNTARTTRCSAPTWTCPPRSNARRPYVATGAARASAHQPPGRMSSRAWVRTTSAPRSERAVRRRRHRRGRARQWVRR